MSAVIYEQTPGGLYAQPGRAVTTFPSGLARIDQTYICATADAATHRVTLAVGNAMPDGNDSPSLETLAIYPEVQGVDRGDGFTEFRVSAYGQTSSSGSGSPKNISGIQLLPVVKYGTAAVDTLGVISHVPIYASLWSITGFVVVPFGESTTIEKVDYSNALNDPFDFSQTVGGPIIAGTKITDLEWTVNLSGGAVGTVTLGAPSLVVNSYSNFGSFAEVSVTISRSITETTI